MLGYSLTKVNKAKNVFPDIEEKEFWDIYTLCKPYTMTSIERMYSLYKSVEYVLENKIEGSFVECGVWRGGSAMLIAKMLFNRNIEDRKIYLFDTYEGMSEPSNLDISYSQENAQVLRSDRGFNEDGSSNWCYAGLEDVKKNMSETNYIVNNIVFIKGKVEETIPSKSPKEKIALLRLDTDWYESTKHELEYLFPKVVENGVLIIDDYGHWEGCRKAVNEYFRTTTSILLNRVDYTGRVGIKTVSNKV